MSKSPRRPQPQTDKLVQDSKTANGKNLLKSAAFGHWKDSSIMNCERNVWGMLPRVVMESDDGVVGVCLVGVFYEAEERVLCWLAINGELALQEKSGWPSIRGFETLEFQGLLVDPCSV
jgi:hypothetical protein